MAAGGRAAIGMGGGRPKLAGGQGIPALGEFLGVIGVQAEGLTPGAPALQMWRNLDCIVGRLAAVGAATQEGQLARERRSGAILRSGNRRRMVPLIGG